MNTTLSEAKERLLQFLIQLKEIGLEPEPQTDDRWLDLITGRIHDSYRPGRVWIPNPSGLKRLGWEVEQERWGDEMQVVSVDGFMGCGSGVEEATIEALNGMRLASAL